MIQLKMKPQDVSRALRLLGLSTEVWAPLRAVKSHEAAEAALATVKRSIHRAFRSRAKELHPDHGGDPQDFQVVSELKSRIENLKLLRAARSRPTQPGPSGSFREIYAEMMRGHQEREQERQRQAHRVVVVNFDDFFRNVHGDNPRPRARTGTGSSNTSTTHDGPSFFTSPDPHRNSARTVVEDLMDAIRANQGQWPKSGTGEG